MRRPSGSPAADLDSAGRPSLRRVAAGMRPHWRDGALSLAASLIFVVQGTIAQVAVGVTMDRGVIHGDGRVLAGGVAVLVACTAAAFFGLLAEQRTMTRFSTGYLRGLRVRLLEHLYSLDIDFFARERSGRIVTRITGDVENVQQMVGGGFPVLARTALGIIFSLVAMLVLSPMLTLVALSLIPPLVLATVVFNQRQYHAQAVARERAADTMAYVNETLSGIALVHACSLESMRIDAFGEAQRAMIDARIRAARIAACFLSSVELAAPLSLGLIFAAGGVLLARGQVPLSAVLSFPLLVGTLYTPIQQGAELANIFQSAFASFAKVFAFLDVQPAVRDAPAAVELSPGAGAVRIDNVHFAYGGGPPVLCGIDLELLPGQRVALLGESGAGKSTLVKLLARLHDVDAGAVRVDGQDVRGVTIASLRRVLALVPQEGFLFSGTVAENMAAAHPTAGRGDVERACATLGIEESLAALPLGLDTRVGNGGSSLSAGQRQLVALVRAFLADPRVLILDEVTSHVDPATMEVLERAFATLLRGRTAVVIAHRVRTALHADRVVMLAGGEVAEDGTPAELLSRGGRFAEWVWRGGESTAGDEAEDDGAAASGAAV